MMINNYLNLYIKKFRILNSDKTRFPLLISHHTINLKLKKGERCENREK